MDDPKKIVLKLDIVGDEGKATRAMSTVAKFCGVKSMAVDGDKGTLTVVVAVDVVRVAKALRKAGFEARVLSVGPEKEEEKKPDEPAKKPADDEPDKKPPPPPCCAGCGACCPPPAPVPVAPFPGGAVVCYEEPPEGNGCVIT